MCNRKQIDANIVAKTMMSLLSMDGETTTKQVKEALRSDDYEASQAEVSKLCAQVAEERDVKWVFNGTHRVYTLNDGAKQSIQDINVIHAGSIVTLRTGVVVLSKNKPSAGDWQVSEAGSDLVGWEGYDGDCTRDNVRCAFSKKNGVKIQDVRARRLKSLS